MKNNLLGTTLFAEQKLLLTIRVAELERNGYDWLQPVSLEKLK
ncbi:hypothetical protein [Bacillus sp. J14TS2]|nr:hypothetical protein [Bacillus sp. J14TS2]